MENQAHARHTAVTGRCQHFLLSPGGHHGHVITVAGNCGQSQHPKQNLSATLGPGFVSHTSLLTCCLSRLSLDAGLSVGQPLGGWFHFMQTGEGHVAKRRWNRCFLVPPGYGFCPYLVMGESVINIRFTFVLRFCKKFLKFNISARFFSTQEAKDCDPPVTHCISRAHCMVVT